MFNGLLLRNMFKHDKKSLIQDSILTGHCIQDSIVTENVTKKSNEAIQDSKKLFSFTLYLSDKTQARNPLFAGYKSWSLGAPGPSPAAQWLLWPLLGPPEGCRPTNKEIRYGKGRWGFHHNLPQVRHHIEFLLGIVLSWDATERLFALYVM